MMYVKPTRSSGRSSTRRSQGVQVHVHEDLDHWSANVMTKSNSSPQSESKQKVATGVFQQVRILHLLVDDSAQKIKISVISAVRIHGL